MPVTKPTIRWLPADGRNVLARPAGALWEAVCIHTTDGGATIEDLAAWFGGKNLAEGMAGSTHFGVGRDGRIGQFVSLQSSAIAQGYYNKPTARLAAQPLNSNHWCIGIELLDGGTPGDHTPAQLAALAHLVAWLFQDQILPNARRTGAAVDTDHILLHREFDAVTRAFCPSWPEERRTWLITQVRARLTEVVPAPQAVDYRALYIEELRGRLRWARDLQTNGKLNEGDALAKLAALGETA